LDTREQKIESSGGQILDHLLLLCGSKLLPGFNAGGAWKEEVNALREDPEVQDAIAVIVPQLQRSSREYHI
jgi:hypothetical protein